MSRRVGQTPQIEKRNRQRSKKHVEFGVFEFPLKVPVGIFTFDQSVASFFFNRNYMKRIGCHKKHIPVKTYPYQKAEKN